MKTANQLLKEKGKKKYFVDLTLTYSEEVRVHYCMYCRQGLFRSQFRAIALDPSIGEEVHALPMSWAQQCPQCGTVYRMRLMNA